MHRFKIYKIQMCKYALINKCDRGENCTFAHDISELRIKPDMRKTKLCKSYILGKCTDQNCIYAHSVNELREVGKPAICQLHREGRCIKGNQCRFAHSIDDINTKLVQFYGMSEEDSNNNTTTTANNNNSNTNNTNNNNSNNNNASNNINTKENEASVGNTKNNGKTSFINKMNTLIDIKNGNVSNNKSMKDMGNNTNYMITKDDCSNSSKQSGTMFPSMCRNKKNSGNVNLNKTNLIHTAHAHCMDMSSVSFRNETKKETHLSETNNVSYIKERDEECNAHHSSVTNEINGNGSGVNYHNLKDTKLYSIPMNNNESHYSFDYDNIIVNKNIKGNYALTQRLEKINNSAVVHNNNGMIDNYLHSNLLTEALNEKSSSLNLHSLLAFNSSGTPVVINSTSPALSSGNPIPSDRLAGLESLIHLNNLNNINTININNVNTINHLNNMNNLNSLNSLNTMNMNAMNYEDMVRKLGTIENAYELMKANSSRNSAPTGTMNHLYPHSTNCVSMNNGGIVDPTVVYNTEGNINGCVINFPKKPKNHYNKLYPIVMNQGSIMNGSIIYNTKNVKEKIQKEINMKNATFIKNKKMGTNNYLYYESNAKKELSDRANPNDVNAYRLNDSLKQVEQYLYAKQNELLKMMKGTDLKNGMEVESGLSDFPAETPIIRKMKKTLVSEEMSYEENEAHPNKMQPHLFSDGTVDSNKVNNEQGGGISMVGTFDSSLLNDNNRVNVKMLLPMLLQMEKARRMENEESRRESMITVGNVSDEKKKELNSVEEADSVLDQQSKTVDLVKKESGEVSKKECKEEQVEINQPQELQEKQEKSEQNTATEKEEEHNVDSKKEEIKEEKDDEKEEKKEQKEETVLNDVNKISKEDFADLSIAEIEKEKYNEQLSLLKQANNYISNYHNYINEVKNNYEENEANESGPFLKDRRRLITINAENFPKENSSTFVKYIEKHKEGEGGGGGIVLNDKSNPLMRNGTVGRHVRKDLRLIDEKDYYRVKKDFMKDVNILNGNTETKSTYDEKEMHSPVLLNSSKMNTRNTYSLFYDSHNNGRSRETGYGCDRKKEMSNIIKNEVEKGIFTPKVMNLLHSCKKGINGSSSYNDLATMNVKNGNEFFLNLLEDSLHGSEKRECGGSDALMEGPEHVNADISRLMNKEMSSNEFNTNEGKKEHSRNGVKGAGRMIGGSMNSFFYEEGRENAIASADIDSKLYENLEVFKYAKLGEEKNVYSSKFFVKNEYMEPNFKNNDRYGIFDRDKLNFKSSSFNNFHNLDVDYECAMGKRIPANGIQNMNLLNESVRDLIDKTNGKTTHIFSEINNPNRSIFSNMEVTNNGSEEKDHKLFDFNIRNLTMDYIDVEGDNLFLNSASTKEVNSFRLSQGPHTSNNSLSSMDENNNCNIKNGSSTINGNGNKICTNPKYILKEDTFTNRNLSSQGRFVLFPSDKILINDNTNYPFHENIPNTNSFINYEKPRESSEFSVFNLMENNNDTSSPTEGYSQLSSFYSCAIPSTKKSLKNEEMDCMEIGSRIGFPFLNNKE